MSWFDYTFYTDKDTVYRLTFVQEIRRVDIRIHDYNYPTKDGVSLTASELRFVNGYIMNFFEGRVGETYYRVSVSKQEDRFIITKKGKNDSVTGVGVEPKTWKESICPMVRGLIFLLQTKDLPVNQLIDLWLLTRKFKKDEMLGELEPLDTNNVVVNPELANCFLIALNICKSSDIMSRVKSEDTQTLIHFRENDIVVFSSLLEIYYK